MPKYQATSYIRLSYTDDRSSESDSVTNQRKLIENFIERNPDIEIISEKSTMVTAVSFLTVRRLRK